MSKSFYVTTPIYYPNGEPHLGSVYTTVICDVLARYHRLKGEPTYFLTGTDEHGTKMAKAADAEGASPQALADKYSKVFADLWIELGITHDDFIRTTEQRHKAGVTKIVQAMLDSGDIYLGSYTGWYDEGQEQFITETEAKSSEYKSTISGRPLTRYEEASYFFKLAKYAPRVLEYIEQHPEFIQPESRRNEVTSKLKQGVEDLSISRATLKWGIPMPNDPAHVVYVWIDALTNYTTALGYGTGDDAKFKQFWPGVHVIGKDILWFHAVYWPAMLMSLGLPLPTSVAAHGWWTAEGKKMSKSLGNVIDVAKIRAIRDAYGLDAFRFYLLRAAPFGGDLDWSDVDFQKSYTEMGNVLGNALNRVINMTTRYCGAAVPPRPVDASLDEGDRQLLAAGEQLRSAVDAAYARFDLQAAATLPIDLGRLINGYIERTAPFKLAKDETKRAELEKVLAVIAVTVYQSLVVLLPIMPIKAAEGLAQMGYDVKGKSLDDLTAEESLPFGKTLGAGSPLFPKVEPKEAGPRP